MFALDVSREVEGYVAEASIRSRRLKTEAGDIPGGGGGEGDIQGVEGGDIPGGGGGRGRCVAARAGTEKGGKHLEAQGRHNNLLREEEPVYKHRLLIQPQYIEANSRRIREKLQE